MGFNAVGVHGSAKGGVSISFFSDYRFALRAVDALVSGYLVKGDPDPGLDIRAGIVSARDRRGTVDFDFSFFAM